MEYSDLKFFINKKILISKTNVESLKNNFVSSKRFCIKNK